MTTAQNECPIRVGNGAVLKFFSYPISELRKGDLVNIWEDFRKKGVGPNCTTETFHLLGCHDILVLSSSERLSILNIVQNLEPYKRSPLIREYFAHYGTVMSVHPAEFYLQETLVSDTRGVLSAPLIGTIFVKLTSDAIRDVLCGLRDANELRMMISRVVNNAISDVSAKCGGADLRWNKVMSIASYGSEDVIVVVFGRSFEFVKRMAMYLGALTRSDLSWDSKHRRGAKGRTRAVAYTSTCMGMKLTFSKKKRPYTVHCVRDKYDRLRWASMVQVLPGSIVRTAKMISSKLKLPVHVTVGRNDLIIEGRRTSNLETFYDQHVDMANVLAQSRTARGTETLLVFPRLGKTRAGEKQKRIRYIDGGVAETKSMRDHKKWVGELEGSDLLSATEKDSYVRIARKLSYFSHDEEQKDYFETMMPIARLAIARYMKVPPRAREDPAKGIFQFPTLLESCYSSRFQGARPLGEVASVSTLGYYTVGVKMLTLLDHVANTVAHGIGEHMRKSKYAKYDVLTMNIVSPVEAAKVSIPDLRLAFICLPPRSLLTPQLLSHSFYHELGHVVFESLRISKFARRYIDEDDKIQRKLLRRVDEIFAEFLSCKILYGMDFNAHIRSLGDAGRGIDEGIATSAGRGSETGKLLRRARLARKYFNYLSRAGRIPREHPRMRGELYRGIDEIFLAVVRWDDVLLSSLGGRGKYSPMQGHFWNIWLEVNRLRSKK